MQTDTRTSVHSTFLKFPLLLAASAVLFGCPSAEHPASPESKQTAAAKPTTPIAIPTAPPTTAVAAASPTAIPGSPSAIPDAAAGSSAGTPSSPAKPGAVIQVPIFGDVATQPKLCEVEFKGKVVYPGKLPEGHRWFFAVAQGDCMAKDAHVIGNFWTNPDDQFFGEVFAKWGSDLTLCVAAVAEPNGPSTLYAKAAGVFHAEKMGEVEITGLVLKPKAGPKLQFAALRPPL